MPIFRGQIKRELRRRDRTSWTSQSAYRRETLIAQETCAKKHFDTFAEDGSFEMLFMPRAKCWSVSSADPRRTALSSCQRQMSFSLSPNGHRFVQRQAPQLDFGSRERDALSSRITQESPAEDPPAKSISRHTATGLHTKASGSVSDTICHDRDGRAPVVLDCQVLVTAVG